MFERNTCEKRVAGYFPRRTGKNGRKLPPEALDGACVFQDGQVAKAFGPFVPLRYWLRKATLLDWSELQVAQVEDPWGTLHNLTCPTDPENQTPFGTGGTNFGTPKGRKVDSLWASKYMILVHQSFSRMLNMN